MSNISALYDFLFAYANSSNEEDRVEIERQIWEAFGRNGAVFVLDMAGFSQTTRRYGIVYYLSMVRRMQIIVGPLVEHYSGKIIKFEADNGFAWFPDVGNAIDAAIAIQLATETMNRTTPEDLDISVSCGIDYGKFLLIEEADFFGDPVNRASKLGEDLANAGDILVTKYAMEQVGDRTKYRFKEIQYSISGLSLDVYRILY